MVEDVKELRSRSPAFALSQCGIEVYFITVKSVSKYPGPKNWLRRWLPKLKMGALVVAPDARMMGEKSAAFKHGVFAPPVVAEAAPTPQLPCAAPL